MFDDDDDRVYSVVVNDEDQHSIWPTDRQPPTGWRVAEVSGSKADCLDHISTVWTDMHPRSLRELMDGQTT